MAKETPFAEEIQLDVGIITNIEFDRVYNTWLIRIPFYELECSRIIADKKIFRATCEEHTQIEGTEDIDLCVYVKFIGGENA